MASAKNALWNVGGEKLLGKNLKRTSSENRTKRFVLCTDVIDGMQKLDQCGNPMQNFVTDADGVGRLPRFSPEDLNVVTLDERCRQLERLMNGMQQQLNLRTESWSKVEDQVDLMETSMTQQVRRIRGIEDAVGIQQQLSEAPPGVRASVSGVQDVPNINNVNGGARSFSEALKIGTAEGVGDTEGAASGNGATVGGATPCVESKDGGASTTDGGSGTTGDDVVKADKANSGSDSDRANDADGVNGGHSVNRVTGASNDGATTGDGIIREGMLEGGFQYPKRTR